MTRWGSSVRLVWAVSGAFRAPLCTRRAPFCTHRAPLCTRRAPLRLRANSLERLDSFLGDARLEFRRRRASVRETKRGGVFSENFARLIRARDDEIDVLARIDELRLASLSAALSADSVSRARRNSSLAAALVSSYFSSSRSLFRAPRPIRLEARRACPGRLGLGSFSNAALAERALGFGIGRVQRHSQIHERLFELC